MKNVLVVSDQKHIPSVAKEVIEDYDYIEIAEMKVKEYAKKGISTKLYKLDSVITPGEPVREVIDQKILNRVPIEEIGDEVKFGDVNIGTL